MFLDGQPEGSLSKDRRYVRFFRKYEVVCAGCGWEPVVLHPKSHVLVLVPTVSCSAVMKLPSLLSSAAIALLLVPSLPSADAMAVPATRVAVLGSGVAGSTAARKLAEAGMKVSVFECGFGVGGRTSTRITRDEHEFAFDHGAQYIGTPKTEAFRQALGEWEGAGFVKEWKARVAHVSPSDDSKAYSLKQDNDGGKKRYIGFPRMNSICQNLLDHDNIDIVLQTRACASFNDDDKQWKLTSHGDRKELGQFDWLIGGDRLSATNNRADLRNAPLDSFKEEVEQIVSVPILVLMVAFESPLQLPYDGITFDDVSGEFGSLGWIARDTSKPGRERDDGRECWVLQSGPEAAKQVLEISKDEPDFEKRRELVREKAKELLMNDLLRAIQKLSGDGTASVPPVVSSVGHRWSAAFPSPPKSSQEMDCFLDIENKFIGTGDYLGKLPGRVEGAYVSGSTAASALLDAQSKYTYM